MAAKPRKPRMEPLRATAPARGRPAVRDWLQSFLLE
jgi:hypothetical protein